ncbi:hypothetical protein JDV02_003409 [Purpureocillium takamizusanense]|uniref:Uncharacterized protein n=1 Tax=Purpureocillium takamizusanense TaxID=2060973 RepID=A0A9Q8V8E7_9HYPO|nr:uncharacterized protein JDV02_003409 [Purpureocillium takamizusanense]UNI17030.1 hypothetical protein JDV02_003409 [Purpureocillium takamizusanense]
MKISSAFLLTLLTSALAAPHEAGVPSDSTKRDVAARDVQEPGAQAAIDVRQAGGATIFQDPPLDADDEEIVPRAPKKKGKKKGKKGKKKGKKGKKGKKAKAAKAADAAAARVTDSNDAPGVV